MSGRTGDDGPQSSVDRSDRGSAVAEFAMVSVVVVLLFLSIVQVCLWIYSRNVLASATADAARYAALADVSAFDVNARVADRMGDGLAAGTKSTLRCTLGGTALMSEVTCTIDSPGLVAMLDGVMPALTVVGHAAREAVS